jgi:hypothetical protein
VVTAIFENANENIPTTTFAVRTKRFNSKEFDEVVCTADTKKIGFRLVEGLYYDFQGYLKTDNWAVEKSTGIKYSYEQIPKDKDGRIPVKDKEKYDWKNRLVCVVTGSKEIVLEDIKNRIEQAKAIMSGSLSF